jgi:ligand-binding SRPBCC domain-containing protein
MNTVHRTAEGSARVQEFSHRFVVPAPLDAVAAVHADTRALRALTPPPVFVQLHRVDPLRDGAVAEFTLWFGPLPIRWTALHSRVDGRGFTDTQVRGPMQRWVHRHSFEPLGPARTRITDRIEYAHAGGVLGVLTRLLFSRLALRLLFAYRAVVTRRRSAALADRQG